MTSAKISRPVRYAAYIASLICFFGATYAFDYYSIFFGFIGICLGLVLLIGPIRYRIIIGDNYIEKRGVFTTTRIYFREITFFEEYKSYTLISAGTKTIHIGYDIENWGALINELRNKMS
mgnify:CR=1 FL=1